MLSLVFTNMPDQGKKFEINNQTEEPKIGIFDPVGEINKKFDLYIKFVVGVLLVTVLTMIFMVATLVLDAFHFNSVVYKEYSEKVNTLETIQKSNEYLMQENKQNQELIIELQSEIKRFLEKK